MTAHLEALLRDCTVMLCDAQGDPAGSGFFVAPGLVLTAAHVVDVAGERVTVWWRGRPARTLAVEWQEPPDGGTDASWDLPDLALLRLDTEAVEGHPCVLLGDGLPETKVFAEGYTSGLSGGHAPDSLRLDVESVRPIGEFTVFKCKDSVVDEGFSGGPLLDLASGHVVGVTKSQRIEPVPLGGIAVSVAFLRERRPGLWAANERFHRTDRRWEFARLNASRTVDPTCATSAFLQEVQHTVASRPAILPPGGARPDIHQIPSVRVLPRDERSPAAEAEDRSLDDAQSRDGAFGGLMRWSPLQTSWRAVVLRGMPGTGKSWLLNTHADTIAADSLSRLRADRHSWASVPVPIVVDCAALGRLLPGRVTQNGLLNALVTALRQNADAPDAASADAVVRLAYADGRLVTCLDALDEVGVADWEKVRLALPILVEHGNRLVVTSRPYSQLRTHTSSLGGCLHAEVAGFSLGQVFAFARAWFTGDRARSGELEGELLDRPELRDLARVPLLAAFLCSLAAEGDQVRVLPTTRAKIYRSVMLGALSGRWRDPVQQAVDPENPPEPALRLTILADAVGRLSRPWRSRVDRFPRSELAAALREHPHYARAEEEAQARWWAWQATRSAGDSQRAPVRDPLVWEYMFDGLLAHDVSDSGEPALRFVHPVLGEFCAAAYVAGLTGGDLREVVESHRWFDASWHEVWPLTADLMPQPDTLVGLFLDSPVDAWFEQTFLASRCTAAAGQRVRPELREHVVTRILTAARRWRPFDRDRAVLHLGELVRARLSEAIEAAHSLILDDCHVTVRLKLASALAEIGDGTGLGIVRASLVDRTIPAAYRAWCARAGVLAEDAEALAALLEAIRNAHTVGEVKLLVNAVPVESRVGGELAGRILQDQSVHGTIRAAVGGALVHTGSDDRIRLAKKLAQTPLTAWGVRAALIADLLSARETDVLPLGLELVEDPNLSVAQRVTLVEALMRQGQLAVLRQAMTMLTVGEIPWEQRRRLAISIAEVGAEGVGALLRHVRSALPIELKMRHIIALVEVGECLDLAAELVADTGTPSWIRSRVATSLLLRGGHEPLSDEILGALATEPDAQHHFQGELIIAMLKRGIPGADDAARTLVAGSVATRRTTLHSSQFIVDLTTAGSHGRAVLISIAQDEKLIEEARALAVIALGDLAPDEAARLAGSLSGKFSRFVNARMTLLLAEKGVVEVTDRLVSLWKDETAVYDALFRLISSARAPRDMAERMLPMGDRPDDPAPPPRKKVQIGSDYLLSAGLSPSSDAEQTFILQWIHQQLEKRVGYGIAFFLTSNEMSRFDQLESNEDRIEFLATRSAGHPELVHAQLEQIREEIVRDPALVPRFQEDYPPLSRLSYVAATLHEWVGTTAEQGSRASADFFGKNARTLATMEGETLLAVACGMTPSLNPYEGHRALVRMARRDGTETTVLRMSEPTRMYDLMRESLDEGNGRRLLDVALARLVLAPESEVAFFYGALGAAILEQPGLSVMLMRNSAKHADDKQRTDGLRTLERQGARFGWPADLVRDLRLALSGE